VKIADGLVKGELAFFALMSALTSSDYFNADLQFNVPGVDYQATI